MNEMEDQPLASLDVNYRPRKRSRYNAHRRIISLGKPKRTHFRHGKTVSSTTDEYEEDTAEERQAHYSDGDNSEEFTCAADGNTNSDLSDVSSSSARSHEVMSLPEDNSDDIPDMDCSASEGDGRSYSENSADDEEELIFDDGICTQNGDPTKSDPFVYPGSPLKLSESILLILTLAVTHDLNGSCLSDVISLVNLHCIPGPQNKCVSSLRALKKYFSDSQLPITKHFYCKFCSEYFGVLGSTADVCSICNKVVSDLKKQPYFVVLSIESQLQELMQRMDIVIPGKGLTTSKIFLLGSVLDLPARCSFLEMVQFNGFCSCCYCMTLEKSCKLNETEGHRGRVTVFPFNFESTNGFGPERTSRGMIADGLEFLQGKSAGKPVNGMKGVCQFASLKTFDISRGICLDYMHGVLLGVTKQLMSLWLESKYKDQSWYCGDYLCLIDERLCSIQPPINITRTPRSIETHPKYFKATEYRNWWLYYSIPCLIGILPEVYLHHFMLLVFGIWLLNQENICPEDLHLSAILLQKFVMLVDALYGERHMSVNLHNLLHINASVYNHGPLWANSSFEFEDANGELTALFHGTQGIDMQIASSISAVKLTPELAKKLEKGSPSYLFYRRMKFGKEQKSIQLEEGVHLLGAFSAMEVTEPLRNALLNCSGEEVLGWCQAFKRVLIKGEVFHSKSYGRVYRRNSYTVTYEDNNCNHWSQCNCIKTAYGQVQHFIKHTPACQNGCVAICKCNPEQ
ncbi:hypothetical protein AWC38_SpisGene12255 [Stylophora pistillata]|uniref:Uncharacterized protein n=1 Tax=Stylophora pistillata TaxID=50429 RepID=A0A2B4S3Z1_STYPI|nr:hypothetical protein AWC38_SpisGene12255 [Stylophora pistillata]